MRIAFYGNCQAELLHGIYSRSVAPWNGAESMYIDAYNPLTDQSVAWLADTDLVVAQIISGGSKAAIDDLPTKAERHLFPAVAAIFLWPFGFHGHPHNKSFWHMPTGPYAIQLGDGYLNRLINQGVDPAEAVRRYLDIDVTREVDLDRLLEVSLDQQRKRDQVSGLAFCDEIAGKFRTERLFATPDHPSLPFARRFVTRILDGIGVGADALGRINRYSQLFPISELPMHPGVVRHFGLTFVEPGQRYRFFHEGNYTFEEFVNRYVRYEWNEALSEGMALAAAARFDEALPKLREGLAHSPQSSAGLRLLASTLSGLGDLPAAIDAAERAIAADPEDSHAYGALFHLMLRAGRQGDAETAIRNAIRLDGDSAANHLALLGLLKIQDRLPEAIAAGRAAVSAEPLNANAHALLGRVLMQTGDRPEAESHLREAVRLAPDNIDYSTALTQLQAPQVASG